MFRFSVMALCILLAVAGVVHSQERPHAFVGARILPVAGDEIPSGVLLVHNGKIQAVGGADVAIPANAVRHDVSGKARARCRLQ